MGYKKLMHEHAKGKRQEPHFGMMPHLTNLCARATKTCGMGSTTSSGMIPIDSKDILRGISFKLGKHYAHQ